MGENEAARQPASGEAKAKAERDEETESKSAATPDEADIKWSGRPAGAASAEDAAGTGSGGDIKWSG